METLPEISDTPEKLALHSQNLPIAGKAAEISLATACVSLCLYPRRLGSPRQAMCTVPPTLESAQPTAAKGRTHVCVATPTSPITYTDDNML